MILIILFYTIGKYVSIFYSWRLKRHCFAFAKDPQWRLSGQLGFIAVLHTWNQLLLDHFHLHCLIPAGALSFGKTAWRHAGKKEKYLFKIGSLSKEFKKRYLDKLKQAFEKKELKLPPDTTKKSFAMLIKKVWAK